MNDRPDDEVDKHREGQYAQKSRARHLPFGERAQRSLGQREPAFKSGKFFDATVAFEPRLERTSRGDLRSTAAALAFIRPISSDYRSRRSDAVTPAEAPEGSPQGEKT